MDSAATERQQGGSMKLYACTLKGADFGDYITFAETAGKARYQYLLHLRDAGWGPKFSDISVRVTKAPIGDSEFHRNAACRGVPKAKIGMQIEVNGAKGVIVGHNSSANLNVLFREGSHSGLTRNCHPNWMTRYFDKDGAVLYDFTLATERQEGCE